MNFGKRSCRVSGVGLSHIFSHAKHGKGGSSDSAGFPNPPVSLGNGE